MEQTITQLREELINYFCHLLPKNVSITYDEKEIDKIIQEHFVSIPVEKPVKPEIAEDFKLLKELAEGELLAYDIYPPKDEVQKIHKERWEEALKNVKKYFR